MAETKAGAESGARLMGLSLKRAGNTVIDNLGAPGAAGESPVMPKKTSFNSAGTKRAGSTRFADYPDASTSPAAYKGGVGTGVGGGRQG